MWAHRSNFSRSFQFIYVRGYCAEVKRGIKLRGPYQLNAAAGYTKCMPHKQEDRR